MGDGAVCLVLDDERNCRCHGSGAAPYSKMKRFGFTGTPPTRTS